MADFGATSYPTARTRHRCVECRGDSLVPRSRPDLGPAFGDLWAWLEDGDDHERLSPEGRARFERLRAAVAAWNARIAAEKACAAR